MPAEDVGAGPAPIDLFFRSQGQTLHYVDWGNDAAPLLILIHVRHDHCRSWDDIARSFRDRWRVVAVDLAGHGDSGWCIGGTYSLSSYVYDLAEFVAYLGAAEVTLMAHSLGGNVALRYAAAAGTVCRVVAIEGLGVSPDRLAERAWTPMADHFAAWLRERHRIDAAPPRIIPTLDDACARLAREAPHLNDAQRLHYARHGLRAVEGGFVWKYDPMTRSYSPYDLGHSMPIELWMAIRCPVLLVFGERSWTSNPALDGRAGYFIDARTAAIAGANHWPHLERHEEFLQLARDFLDAADSVSREFRAG